MSGQLFVDTKWVAVILLSLVCALTVSVVMSIHYRKENIVLTDQNTRYERQITALERQCDQCEAERQDLVRLLPGLDDKDEFNFKHRGLESPAADIIRDMEKREELMVVKGVFGARPSFYVKARSYLINGKWAYYSVVDGARTGESLLAYTVDDNGDISWRVLDTVIRTVQDPSGD